MKRRYSVFALIFGVMFMVLIPVGCSRTEGHNGKNGQTQDQQLKQEVADAQNPRLKWSGALWVAVNSDFGDPM